MQPATERAKCIARSLESELTGGELRETAYSRNISKANRQTLLFSPAAGFQSSCLSSARISPGDGLSAKLVARRT